MRQNGGGGCVGIQPLVTARAQILIGGRTNTEPSLPRTACQRTFQPEIWMNGELIGRRLDWGRSEGDGRGGGRGRGEGFCLVALARVLKERWGRGGGGREGGLSPYFNSCLIRVLAAKHLSCSSPTPIHITPVLLHPWSIYPLVLFLYPRSQHLYMQ